MLRGGRGGVAKGERAGFGSYTRLNGRENSREGGGLVNRARRRGPWREQEREKGGGEGRGMST